MGGKGNAGGRIGDCQGLYETGRGEGRGWRGVGGGTELAYMHKCIKTNQLTTISYQTAENSRTPSYNITKL